MACCTCSKTVQGVSRFLTYFAFLVTIVSLGMSGWSVYCGMCTVPPCVSNPTGGTIILANYTATDKQEVCHYVGLFEWCEGVSGRETCYQFHPRTLNKAWSNRSAYAGAQALMVLSAILSSFYVIIDIANWFTRATQDNRAVVVLKYSQDAWFFYVITTVQGVFALAAQATWENQRLTNKWETPECGVLSGFRPGPAFALSVLAWVLCLINIILRLLGRKYYKDDATAIVEEGPSYIAQPL